MPNAHCAGNGQLVARLMDQELDKQGYKKETGQEIGHLLRQFLMEHGVIHKIDSENYLVPSTINPDPALPLDLKLGYFPSRPVVAPLQEDDTVCSPYTTQSPKLSVFPTGLVYRRMLHLPPIASGFWSKLISLFIQHVEILMLISEGNIRHAMQVGTNHLRGMIGNVSVEWQYWKTGIMLIADDKLLMRVNSLRRDVFEDPQHHRVISSTLSKIQHCQYREAGKWVGIPSHLSEVIEILVPVAYLKDGGDRSLQPTLDQTSVSAKLLAKALELVDEILKNHCEHLAMNGIYTVNDMLHLVPCPLCYGDEDCREPHTAEGKEGKQVEPQNREQQFYTQQTRRHTENPISQSVVVLTTQAPSTTLYTFRVDECIQQTLVSDNMQCPKHGNLKISFLAPDIVSLITFTCTLSDIETPFIGQKECSCCIRHKHHILLAFLSVLSLVWCMYMSP